MAGYEEVITSDTKRNAVDKVTWTPFLRQLLVCSSVWVSFFAYGMCIGAPTVFIPQIRRDANSTDVISDDMASWLASAVGFSGTPCVLILSIVTRLLGRRIVFMIATIDTFTAFIVFYCSNNVTQLLISQLMQGLFSAAQMIIAIMILTEYTSPKYRGIFLTFKVTIYYWGIWTANAIGTFFPWKNIGLLGVLCALYILLTMLFWPESPYWLASKGKYKECAASHRWLKGCDDQSEKELELLINTHKEYINRSRESNVTAKDTVKKWYSIITSTEFYKPVLIASMTGILCVTSGKLVCTVYAIDIIKKITDSESTAYNGMLILDGITIASMYAGCVLSKFVSRRCMLLISSSIAVFFLYSLSLYFYLITQSVITENHFLSLGLLVLFSIAISCGPLLITISVCSELIPLKARSVATCFVALEGKLLPAIVLKISPSLFKALELHGVFLLFGVMSTCLILLLYKFLPETKDKTLQEIMDSMKGDVEYKNDGVRVTDKLVENVVK